MYALTKYMCMLAFSAHTVHTKIMYILVPCVPHQQVASTALVSEAVSFLNGAHLNPRGQLGNLFRRWHRSLSSTTPATGVTSGQSSPSLPSLILSELGVDQSNRAEMSQALSNPWTLLDSCRSSITVSDVLKQCKSEYFSRS